MISLEADCWHWEQTEAALDRMLNIKMVAMKTHSTTRSEPRSSP